MQNEIATMDRPANAEKVGKRKVDTSRGEHRMELNRECWSRPDDERFLSLDELRAHVGRQQAASQQFDIALPELTFLGDPDRDFLGVQGPDGEELSISHWATSQLCQHVGAPADYIRSLPANVAAMNLQASAMRFNDSSQLYVDTDRDQIRAVTSPSYGRIHNADVVDRMIYMAEHAADTWKVPGCMDWATSSYDPTLPVTLESTTLFAGDRDMAIFLCNDLDPIEVGKLDDGSPDLMFRGIFARNSEVGYSKLELFTAMMRGICANRCMWGVQGFESFEIVHTQAAPGRFKDEIRPFLDNFGQNMGDKQLLVDGVKLAKEPLVRLKGKDESERRENQVSFLTELGFSAKIANDIISHEAPGTPRIDSVWDVSNKLTSFAQTVPHGDSRLVYEHAATGLLNKVAPAV